MSYLRDSRLVIGIPTVSRDRDYLLETVGSIVAGVPAVARGGVEVVVFNAEAEPDRHKGVARLLAAHGDLVRAGFLHVAANPDGHAELRGWRPPAAEVIRDRPHLGLKLDRLDDEGLRAWSRWETKLALDAAYLMQHAAPRGDYYLHVEDDFVAAPGFYRRLVAWVDEHFARRDDWSMLSLFTPFHVEDRQEYPLHRFYGSSGMLFRTGDVAVLAAELRARFDERPFDHLVGRILAEWGRPVYACAPALFRHVGLVSSFAEKATVEPIRPLHGSPKRGALGDLLDVLRYRPWAIARFVRHRILR